MKREIHHYCFSLSFLKADGSAYVPVLDFEESVDFEEILSTIIYLENRGIHCSLSCETWSTFEEVPEDD